MVIQNIHKIQDHKPYGISWRFRELFCNTSKVILFEKNLSRWLNGIFITIWVMCKIISKLFIIGRRTKLSNCERCTRESTNCAWKTFALSSSRRMRKERNIFYPFLLLQLSYFLFNMRDICTKQSIFINHYVLFRFLWERKRERERERKRERERERKREKEKYIYEIIE